MRNWAKSRKNRPRGSMAAGQAKPVLTLIMLHYFPNTAIINKTPALPIRRPLSMIALNQQTEPTNSTKPPPPLPEQSSASSFWVGFVLLCTAEDTQTRCGAARRLFLQSSRHKSRTTATSLQPTSTAPALLGSGPFCSPDKRSRAQACSGGNTLTMGEHPLRPSCAARGTAGGSMHRESSATLPKQGRPHVLC